MRLKRLSMVGFKSFATKTDFQFLDGLTCIVGPNGCGKSNVVDAIKWVLGEQRASALRGKDMEDVIFAGTVGRKPLGMAEVSLTFENSDGLLDVDWTEVEVSRRLFRDGTSEYLINRNRCRLRDIRELLMDTGSGPGALTIMEQGKIDQILRESHHERRAVFEEAAGVSKYKARRKETLRRLERVEGDLLRISDLVAEKQRLVRSLKIQAGRAERYRTILDEMRKKRLALAVHRYGRLLTERDRATARVEELQADEGAARAEVESAVAACRAAEEEVDRGRTLSSQLEQRVASLEGRMDTAREKSAFAARLAAELDGKIRWYKEEVDSALERLEELAEAGEDVARTLLEAERDRTAREDDVAAAESAIAELAAGATSRRGEARDLERRAYAAFSRRNELESELSALQAQVQALRVQSGRLDETRERMAADVAAAATSVEGAAALATSTAGEARTAAAALAQAESAAASAESGLSEARDEVGRRSSALSSLTARRDLLEDLSRRMEGLAEGARRLVADARSDGGPSGVRGVLADLLDVEPTDAAAVAAALGPYASAVVVERFDDAVTAARHLREAGAGGCLLLPLDEVGGRPESATVDGLAARVGAPADVLPAVRALLGLTIEVTSLHDARDARRTHAGARFVTTDGDVVEALGTLTAGSAASGGGVLERRVELGEVRERVAAAETELSVAERALAGARTQHEDARHELAAARAAAGAADFAAERARAAVESGQANYARLCAESERIDSHLAEIVGEIERVSTRAAACGIESQALIEEQQRVEEQRAAAVTALAAADEALRSAEAERADARVRHATVAERCAALAARRSAVGTEMADLERTVEDARSELVGCERRKTEALERGEQARDELARSEKEREQVIGQLAEVRHGLSMHATRLDERRRALAEFEGLAGTVGRELQKFRLAQNEARVRVETLVERIAEELETDLHSAWESSKTAAPVEEDASATPDGADAGTPVYAEGAEPFDEDAIEKAVQELRDKLARMGNVNLEALDQLESTETEAAELLTEHDDLTRSRQTLLDTIKRIDVESRELFMTTFEKIRKNFREMFRRLFEGGKADVMLDEGQDVLEAGVEIVARPPGKEPRSISLLSGGERTMTAVALLFAIYQSRASSFCLLDEVDAALDESNVGRFAAVVREFANDSQFIIITHNKKTMAVAETIFGVTMSEPGVSRQIAVRIDEVGDDGQIRAA